MLHKQLAYRTQDSNSGNAKAIPESPIPWSLNPRSVRNVWMVSASCATLHSPFLRSSWVTASCRQDLIACSLRPVESNFPKSRSLYCDAPRLRFLSCQSGVVYPRTILGVLRLAPSPGVHWTAANVRRGIPLCESGNWVSQLVATFCVSRR